MRFIYLCNAVDEQIRIKREIATDSPAATAKVLGLCQALQQAGLFGWVLSLGRGRQNGSWQRHRARVGRVDGTPILYASFWHVPLFTHVVSAWSLICLLRRLAAKPAAFIVYNRSEHYIPALVLARLMGLRCYLDLEDGHHVRGKSWWHRLRMRVLASLFDKLCSSGVLLATGGLRPQTGNQRLYVCPGVVQATDAKQDWRVPRLRILLSGTLHEERGCLLLIRALRLLAAKGNAGAGLEFLVTGAGPMEGILRDFAAGEGRSLMRFDGRLGRDDYLSALATCHVGLMLNLPSCEISGTTFPSKVLEYTAHGLLVLSTRVSDVAQLLGEDGALLLDSETPDCLAGQLDWLASHRDEARRRAENGNRRAWKQCNSIKVGRELKAFLQATPGQAA